MNRVNERIELTIFGEGVGEIVLLEPVDARHQSSEPMASVILMQTRSWQWMASGRGKERVVYYERRHQT